MIKCRPFFRYQIKALYSGISSLHIARLPRNCSNVTSGGGSGFISLASVVVTIARGETGLPFISGGGVIKPRPAIGEVINVDTVLLIVASGGPPVL